MIDIGENEIAAVAAAIASASIVGNGSSSSGAAEPTMYESTKLNISKEVDSKVV